jgi:dihydrofolate reductase
MGTVVLQSVVSLDGFIADDNDDPGPLHEWYFSGDTPLTHADADGAGFDHSGAGSRYMVSSASVEYVRSTWDSLGTIVMGRHLFDLVNGWEGHPPAGEHVVVVSHRPKPEGWHPEGSYQFVDGVTAAIAKAQELAGERTVAVNAGEVGGQILEAGLVDEVAMDVVPVVFGSGKRYFGTIDRQHLLEDPDVVIRGDRVLHLRFQVRR